MKEFKIRCSAIGTIMSGSIGLTDKQQSTLDGLVEKKSGKGVTDKQSDTINDLINKRDNPVLPKGAQTYCDNWIMEQIYSRRKEIKSKYFEKGNIMEQDAIDKVAEHLDIGILLKNEKHYSNDFMDGTPDALPKGMSLVIDTKNSWDFSTFPFLDTEIQNEDYEWQLQGYMALTNKKAAKLVYCLLDTPMHLIEREARFYCLNNGYEELDNKILAGYVKRMTYKDLADHLKYKSFDLIRNNDAIKLVEGRVVMCRKYIKERLTGLNF